MAAIFNWCEDNGLSVLSPPRGTTRSQANNPPVDCSWKATDDAKTTTSGTSYVSASIRAGSNSYTKYLYGQFTGAYHQISNCYWSAHVNPEPLPADMFLKGTVTSLYKTPSTNIEPSLTTDFTDVVPINNGLPVMLSQTGPESTSKPTLESGGGFTQYLVTQLQTTSECLPGDLDKVTLMIVFDEN